MEIITFILGAILGALSSWGIAHAYYKKAAADQRRELDQLKTALRSRNTVADFEERLVSDTWNRTFVEHREIWICASDNTFQIQEGDEYRSFHEPWTEGFLDPNSTASAVCLKIGSTVVREVTFVSLDSRRVFVPMPELRGRGDSGDVQYVWSRSSLEVKVCGVIGHFGNHDSLAGSHDALVFGSSTELANTRLHPTAAG